MGKLMRKAAFMAAKKATKDLLGNLGQVGASLLPGFAGEIELKNGRRIVVESVGTAENPKVFVSLRTKWPRRTLRQTIMRIAVLTFICVGGVMLANKVLDD
jgi:hypothetical protein